MRILGKLAAAAVVVCTVQAARAADVTGKWKGAFEFQGDSITVTLDLKTEGAKVTGEVVGLPTSPAEIHDGALTGQTVTFWVNSDYQGQTYKLVYNGKIAGDQIVFDFGTEDGSWSAPLTVKKDSADPQAAPPAASPATPQSPATPPAPDAAPALSTPTAPPPPNTPSAPPAANGDWKGSFEFEGSSVPVTFHLKDAGGAVTGTIEGMGGAPVDLHEGKVEGDSVTFWVNTDYQGQTYMLVYKGKLAADHIDFTFGTVDGSWGSEVSAKKVAGAA